MSVKIPDEKLSEIRNASDIVDVIGEYVQLKKNGRQYGGLCPFHDEKTPSFSVSEEKQVYHCFGCGAGGNVFTFLQELEGWSFTKTVTHLADKNKISLPQITQLSEDVSQVDTSKIEAMKKAHQLAASTYHSIFMFTEEGSPGRVYAEERWFSQAQIDHFKIGYALDEWETISKVLEQNDFDLEIMEEAGLVAKRKTSGFYDLFRNRLIFPISDNNGDIVGFGGRIIGEGQPKYLNSPETPIYQKAKTLFHMYEARPIIRKKDRAYLFEGAFDVMAAWKSGIENAVATLGTALSPDHAKLLRRNAEEIVVCFDGDKAGREAIRKTIPYLEKVGCRIQVCLLPDGYDPDDFVKEFGSDAFKLHLEEELLSVMAFKMHDAKQTKNLENEGERLKYIEDMLEEIAGLEQSIEQEHYLRQLSNEFNLSLHVLQQEMERKEKKQGRSKQDQPAEHRKETIKPHHHFQTSRPMAAHIKAERMLLAHMLQDEEMIWRVTERLESGFNIDEHGALYAYLLSFVSQHPEKGINDFIESLEDQNLAKLAAYLLMQDIKIDCTDDELHDYIKKIEQYPKLLQIKEKQQAARLEQDPILAAQKQMELIREKRELLGK
ncbi:DNA primase [Shouchella sp. JSM 1781072]|uniref:DNA primase n=1 Tax=Bacillaceae TaxID=186817 RepID=UPI000C07BC07|nr:DNA primase [Bacillus sp. Marseille-P3800]